MSRESFRDKILEFFDPDITRAADLRGRLVYSGVADAATIMAFLDARERGALACFPELASDLDEVRTWNNAVDRIPVSRVHLKMALRQISEQVLLGLSETIAKNTSEKGFVDPDSLRKPIREKASSLAAWLENPSINHVDRLLPRATDLYERREQTDEVYVYAMRIVGWEPDLLVRDFSAKWNWRLADRAPEPNREMSL